MTATVHDGYDLARAGYTVTPNYIPTDTGCSCGCTDLTCRNRGKHPIGGDKKHATAAPRTIKRWSTDYRAGFNIGIQLELSDLVDIAPDCPEREAEFHRLGLPPGGLVWRSGSGAGHTHYVYRRPAHCPVTKINKPGDFDIMAIGMAAAPPSVSGKGPYVWESALIPRDALPEAPDWAVAKLIAQGEKQERSVTAHPAGVTGDDPDTDDEAEPPVRLGEDALRVWRGDLVKRKPDGEIDRSESLYWLGCVLDEANMTRRSLRAEIEASDARLGWDCYTNRPAEYDRLVAKVIGRQRKPKPATAYFGSQRPAEDDAPCSDQLAAMQARIDQLEAENTELRARFQSMLKLDRNPKIKAERTVVKAVAWELQSAYDGGRADPDGWVKTWIGGIAENAGTSPDRASVHTTTMHRDGLIEKAVRKEPVEKVDPDTGELTTVVLPRVYLRCTSVTDLLEKAAAWTPSPSPKKPKQGAWGGFRESNPDTCPHDNVQTTCLDCGATLDREPQDAGHDPDHTPPADAGVADTLQPQDAVHDRRRDIPDGYSECVNCHSLTRAGEALCWSCDFRINGNVRTPRKAAAAP